MIFILLSIILTTYLGVVFILFPRFKIDTFQAIVINYFVCVLTGIAFSKDSFSITTFYEYPDYKYSFAVGSMFIIGFLVIAKTVQYFGLSVATVTQRMSLLCTTLFAVFVFQESLSLFKIAGLLIACIALVCTNWNPSLFKQEASSKLFIFPVAVFLLISFGDSILLYAERAVLTTSGDPRFVISTFFTAASFGLISLCVLLLLGKTKFHIKNLIAGVLLGVPNFFSLYFTLKALGTHWDASIIFPSLNIGVIVLSTLIGFLFFKEKLTVIKTIGISLSLLAILIISFS